MNMQGSTTRSEIRRIKRICRKILGSLSSSAEIHVLEEVENLKGIPHCDAVIKLGKCIILLEITGRVTPSNDLKKLNSTLLHLGKIISDFAPHRFKILPIIHMRKISSMDVRIVRYKRVNRTPIMLIKCHEKLRETLISHCI